MKAPKSKWEFQRESLNLVATDANTSPVIYLAVSLYIVTNGAVIVRYLQWKLMKRFLVASRWRTFVAIWSSYTRPIHTSTSNQHFILITVQVHGKYYTARVSRIPFVYTPSCNTASDESRRCNINRMCAHRVRRIRVMYTEILHRNAT